MMGMLRNRCLDLELVVRVAARILLLVALLLTCTQAAAESAVAVPVCSLKVAGTSEEEPTATTASIKCIVGNNDRTSSIEVASTKSVCLKGPPNMWQDQRHCKPAPGCFVSLDGVQAVFTFTNITGVTYNGSALVCITGSSNVLFQEAVVTGTDVWADRFEPGGAVFLVSEATAAFEHSLFSRAGSSFGAAGAFIDLKSSAVVRLDSTNFSDDGHGVHPLLLPDDLGRCRCCQSFIVLGDNNTVMVHSSTLNISMSMYVRADGSNNTITVQDSQLTSQCFGLLGNDSAGEADRQSQCYGAHSGGIDSSGMLSSNTVKVSNTTISNDLCGYQKAGYAVAASEGSYVELNRVMIRDCSCSEKGCVYSRSNTTVHVKDSQFVNNHGTIGSIAVGGAYSVDGATHGDVSLTVMDSSFQKNTYETAGISAGCISIAGARNITLNATNVTCTGKSFVASVASSPVCLNCDDPVIGIVFIGNGAAKIVDNNISGFASTEGLGGGMSFSGSVRADVINCALTTNFAGTGGAIYMESSGNSSLGIINCTFTNNTAMGGDGADVYASKSVLLHIQHSNINIHSPSVSWWRSQCVAGEVLQQERCAWCERSSYSLDSRNSTCDVCPAVGVNCTGGDALVPLQNYWHSSRYSIQLHKCPHTSAVCLAGGICAEGYTGNLCGSCQVGYGSNGPFKCSKCMPAGAQWAVYISAAFFLVGFIAYTAHATWKDNQEGSRDLRPSDLLKVLVLSCSIC